MNKKYILYCFTFLFIFLLEGKDTTSFHRYLWANYNHFSGNLRLAHDWYKTLFSSHCSTYAYKGYVYFLFDTNQNSKIVELIPSLDARFEKDPEVQLIFALALEKCKKINEADTKLITLSSTFKNSSEITLRTTQTYIRRKEPENALLTIDTFLNNSPRRPNNFIFYFLKSQIHLQLNQLPQALNNITLCLDMHPKFDKGWLLFATLQEQQGQIQQALQGYKTFLELSGGNNTIEQHLFSLMLHHKTNTHYFSFHKSYFDLASSSFNKKEYHACLKYLALYLKLQPNDYQAIILKIQTLAYLNDYKQITELLTFVSNNNQFSPEFWPKHIYLLYYNNINVEKIISLLQTLAKTHKDNCWFPLYAADLCIRTNQISDAIESLNQGLNISTDITLNAKIYLQLSLLSYQAENYTDMIFYLEKGYALNNKCDYLNNSLAYYWATKGKDLQKAEYFFNNIDNNQKTNPYFLDTQALIFYKQHNYDKAQHILESLQNTNNTTILLHLAKTYYKLNNKEKALTLSKAAETYITTNKEKKHLEKLQLLLTQT